MTIREMWPLLRPLSRRLALLGWVSSAAGMAAGLAIAIASGTRISPMMSTMQLVAMVSMAVAVTSFVTAASVQPRSAIRDAGESPDGLDNGGLPDTVRSFLLGSLALLLGAVVFALAGFLLRSGHSAQTVAFCQVFFLGAAASGFTFMLFSRVIGHRGRS
ncbi:membrane protein implicated in regulation of membrane protease activity [Arthrobacter ginsengisoli]|uniref:Membrane protein implicated in regulation of membrane protease activity n=1 Tax=Arthrobacter ginsengisoli TaxID=1356565 RepID=A0ABU1UGW8_9MICC|nr:hypothetical protein [Arthrobacter ginsengisoli]MDR7084398.1 membrane protein implicated in regulation of membrane protease activity [Arthrobacter ginsengisoli]